MKETFILFILTLLALGIHSSAIYRPILKRKITTSVNIHEHTDPIPKYKTVWYDQVLDHFNFYPTTKATFKERVLICEEFWDGSSNAPIFFYTGNEGDIVMFYNNTGFMFDIAPKFHALVVFAEHRYYGETLPMGDKSWEKENIQYLNSWQALADYALLIPDLKKMYNMDPDAPVIAFGGSYGGMLSTYFRIKYPHVVDGAIAASAPVLQFEGYVSPKRFNQIVTKDFADALPNNQCSNWIQKAFLLTQSLGQSQSGRNLLSRNYNLCSPLKDLNDVNQLISFITDAIVALAMLDYPYETYFLQPLPAWPVNASCEAMKKIMDKSKSDEAFIQALASVAGVYYNTSGSLKCFNTSSGDSPSLGDQSWFYQACSEMVLVIGQYGGDTDMFLPAPWDLKEYEQMCQAKFGVTPRPYWNVQLYGVNDLRYASNIVFSNGNLDPWSGGGMLQSMPSTSSIVTVFIQQGAHHLDLRSANINDPESVIMARQIHVQNIEKWINEKKRK
jgi:lysosomal Pro-X carboxypeptidase